MKTKRQEPKMRRKTRKKTSKGLAPKSEAVSVFVPRVGTTRHHSTN